MTVARYIALPLISRYRCLDPTNCAISGVHCTVPLILQWSETSELLYLLSIHEALLLHWGSPAARLPCYENCSRCRLIKMSLKIIATSHREQYKIRPCNLVNYTVEVHNKIHFFLSVFVSLTHTHTHASTRAHTHACTDHHHCHCCYQSKSERTRSLSDS